MYVCAVVASSRDNWGYLSPKSNHLVDKICRLVDSFGVLSPRVVYVIVDFKVLVNLPENVVICSHAQFLKILETCSEFTKIFFANSVSNVNLISIVVRQLANKELMPLEEESVRVFGDPYLKPWVGDATCPKILLINGIPRFFSYHLRHFDANQLANWDVATLAGCVVSTKRGARQALEFFIKRESRYLQSDTKIGFSVISTSDPIEPLVVKPCLALVA